MTYWIDHLMPTRTSNEWYSSYYFILILSDYLSSCYITGSLKCEKWFDKFVPLVILKCRYFKLLINNDMNIRLDCWAQECGCVSVSIHITTTNVQSMFILLLKQHLLTIYNVKFIFYMGCSGSGICWKNILPILNQK